jgi:hypothetical protein
VDRACDVGTESTGELTNRLLHVVVGVEREIRAPLERRL